MEDDGVDIASLTHFMHPMDGTDGSICIIHVY